MNERINRSGQRMASAMRLSTLTSAVAALVACGGGSDSGGGSAPPPAAASCQTHCVSGTAATGKALAAATVTLTDAGGATRTATSATDGSFSIDSTGLVAPFLLRVAAAGGATYYSVSADTNAKSTVNITQLTDLLVRTWYGAQGVATDAAFGAPATNPAPQPGAVQVLAGSVQSVVQLWLDRNNVPSGFNVISTPFSANSSGADAVLDATTVAYAGPTAATVTVSGGTLTQTSAISIGAASVSVTTNTSDSASGTTSSSMSTSAVPNASGSVAALDALKARLDAFASMVNAKGANLQSADVQPYVDPGLLDDGQNATQFIAHMVDELAGTTLAFAIHSVSALDTAGNTAELRVATTLSAGGQSEVEVETMRFKQVGGSWVIAGNGQAFKFDAQAEMRTDQGANAGWNACNGAPASGGMSINVGVRAPAGLFAGGSVTGGGTIWPNSTSSVPTQCVASGTLVKGPQSLENGITSDAFFLNTGPIAPASQPAAGTPISAAMTPVAGGAAQHATLTLNAWTSDPVTITSPTSFAIGSITFGTPMQVNWTLPKTYAIQSIRLGAVLFTGPSESASSLSCFEDGHLLATNATSGALTLPATCGGQPVVQVNLNLSVDGVNGERSQSIFAIE